MKRLLKTYNELLGAALGIILFFVAPPILRWLDPTSAAEDAGVLHTLILGVIIVLVASSVAWAMFSLSFPDLFRLWDEHGEGYLQGNNKTQLKAIYTGFVIYFIYFLALVLTVNALL
jgi:hypothetical protein